MSTLKLKGSTSGYVELTAPATAGDNTITLPTTAGTVAVKDASNNVEVGTGVTIGSPSSNTFTVSTNGSERIRIDSTGRLGIGTATPESLFHVNGDATAIRITRGSSIGFLYNTGTSLTSTTRLQGNDGPVEIYTNATQPVLFSAGGSEKARILPTGGLTFNGDTAAANALDDYEEGTFTVEMQYFSGGGWFGVGFSNTPQTTGYYVKIGNSVTCYYYSTDFQVNSGATAPARFGGLPFAAASLTEGYVTGTVTHVTCFQQANQNFYVAPNATNAIPIQLTSTDTNTWNSNSNVYIMWAITYRTV